MMRPIKNVLSEKKGIAEALGITMVGLAILVAIGLVVANYAIVSRQSSQVQTLGQQISNRAEVYAAGLNTDLASPQVPTMTRQCSSTPAMCTVILSATPSADGASTVLRIQGDAVSGVGQSVTKDVTLVAKEVTHVTGIDQNGDNIWALSNEGLHYRIWGVADGDPTVVDPSQMTGPTSGASWVSIADRAGIDSTGSLWTWGMNTIGQAGIGSAGATPAAPQKFAGATGFRSVVTSDDRGYAIDSKGDLWVWGRNDKGQLGLGNTNQVMTPTRIANSRTMSVAAGKDNVFMLGMDGSLSVVGASQAGLPANSGLSPQVITPGTRYRAVAASTTGAVAMIDSTGKLTMAGNAYAYTPVAGGVFTSVALGGTSGYAIGSDSKVYAWGQGANGQLGLGATTSVATPTPMAGINAVAVTAATTSALVLDTSGKLFYVGRTQGGSTSGTLLPQASTPTKLLAESSFRAVSASGGSTPAALLDTAGNLYGMATAQPGLWPFNYLGANDQPVRMPAPAGFAPVTW